MDSHATKYLPLQLIYVVSRRQQFFPNTSNPKDNF